MSGRARGNGSPILSSSKSPPYALKNIATKTYSIFSSVFICGAPFIYFFVPETTGLSLENMVSNSSNVLRPRSTDYPYRHRHRTSSLVEKGSRPMRSAPGLTGTRPSSRRLRVSELRPEPRMERIGA